MTHIPVPGRPQRPRWTGPSVLAVLPILTPGMGRQIADLLWAGGFFLVSALLLFWLEDTRLVQLVVALQISVLLLLAISVVCARRKSIFSFVATFVLTALSLEIVFPVLLLVTMTADRISVGRASLGLPLLRLFLGVGIREELVKAVPVFLMAVLARWPRVPRWLTVRDAIDGVLIGAAAGVAFTLLETLGEYVPRIAATVANRGGGLEAQGYYGLTLMLARIVSSAGGHVAWSGFFGYTIGLAQTYPPHRRPLTVLIGLAIAACLHALWDDFTSVPFAGLVIALASYTLLVSAAMSARQRVAAVPPGLSSAAQPGRSQSSHLWLHVGANRYSLGPGTVLTATELPGLEPNGPGPVVASVQAHPAAPQMLGLRNDSKQTWSARAVNQPEAAVPAGRTARLTPGLSIRFGKTLGLVG